MRVRTGFVVIAVVGLCLLVGCRQAKAPDAKDNDLPTGKVDRTFTSPKKHTYAIRFVDKPDDAPKDEVEGPDTAEATEAAKEKGAYTGKSRKVAKLSIVTGDAKSYTDLADLLADLPSEATMKAKNIATGPGSDRVEEEKQNVRVRCWLYAASREDDNDYHLILGREPGKTPKRYMTMELSGLPPKNSPFRERLENVRKVFTTFFGDDLPGSRYSFYDPPIPVEVEGSLFWDASHESGSKPGPSQLRPNMPTIWEVHPISNMVFEPDP